MTLTSCGKTSYVGTYSFQMGRDNSTHFSFRMDLLGEDFIDTSSKVRGKKFELTIDVNTGAVDGGEEDDPATTVFDFLNGEPIPGYYTVGDPTEKDRLRLNLGLGLGNAIEDLIKSIAEALDYHGELISFDYDLTEKVIFSEIDSKSVYLTIPVSLDDFAFQLYWYGYDIQYNVEGEGTFDIVKLSEEQTHLAGTHPTADDVKEINKTYPDNHVGTEGKVEYRDFHALTLGLRKK